MPRVGWTHVRHHRGRRLRRHARHAARGPGPTGVPRLRLGRHRARARRRDLAGPHRRRHRVGAGPRTSSANSAPRASPRASATPAGRPTAPPKRSTPTRTSTARATSPSSTTASSRTTRSSRGARGARTRLQLGHRLRGAGAPDRRVARPGTRAHRGGSPEPARRARRLRRRGHGRDRARRDRRGTSHLAAHRRHRAGCDVSRE